MKLTCWDGMRLQLLRWILFGIKQCQPHRLISEYPHTWYLSFPSHQHSKTLHHKKALNRGPCQSDPTTHSGDVNFVIGRPAWRKECKIESNFFFTIYIFEKCVMWAVQFISLGPLSKCDFINLHYLLSWEEAASFYVREDLSSGDLFPKLERLSAHQRNPSKESQRNWGQIGGGRNQSSFPVFSFLGNIVAGTWLSD